MNVLDPVRQLRIVKYPHPALRYPAKPVPIIDREVRLLVGRMWELMYLHHGLGLAAPQLAMPFQIFVINPTGDPQQQSAEQIFINPVLVEKSGGMVEAEEGCLSFPGLYQKIRRARVARIQAYDLQGERIELVGTDLVARLLQHEADHLHGKLFIDYFVPLARLAAKDKLAEFEREYRLAQKKGDIPSNREIQRHLQRLERPQVAAL